MWTAAARAKRQQEIAVKAGFIFIRGNKHHNYLTLVELPAGDWPTPALLTRTAWEALVAAGDLAGARFVDSQGRAWAAVDGEIVSASGVSETL